MKIEALFPVDLKVSSLATTHPAARCIRPLLALLLAWCLFLVPANLALAADGDLDSTFKPNFINKSRVIRGKVDYPDGKFLIYGFFTSTGQLRQSIARMNSDGTTDTTFYTAHLDGEVRHAHMLASGQIFIAGNFRMQIGSTNEYYYNFARLNADGTLDTTFPRVFNASGAINDFGVQADGKILVGGYSMAVSGIAANTFQLLRLNGDGTTDDTYPKRSAPGGYVSSVKILSGDAARIFGTLPRAGTAHVDYLLVLASTGVVQTNIGDEMVDGPILNMGQQSNGQWLICGQFQHVLGVAMSRVARFKLDMSLDTSFNIGAGANAMVSQLTVQGDDKVVLAGNFDSFNGTPCGYLVRLDTYGGVDPTFATGTGANARIVRMTTGAGGSGWMIYGYFETYNYDYPTYIGGRRAGIASLDANGNLNSTYGSMYVLANYRGTVYALVQQSDGKILVGGDFTGISWNTPAPGGGSIPHNKYCGGFARLNPDGLIDTSFKGGVDGYVDSIAIQADGKILLVGKFGAAQAYARTSLARLNPDGSLDTTFNPLVVKGDGSVSDLRQVLLLSGGQLMAAGDFASVNTIARNIVTRLNGDGSLDAAFNAQLDRTGVSNGVGYRVAQAAGNYVVGGSLVLSGFESDGPQGFLARFNNTGALDPSFGPTAPPTPVPNVNILQNYKAAFPRGPVSDMLLQPDGKIVVSGGFYQIMDGSGSPPARSGSARFSSSGLLDNTFIPDADYGIAAMALQPNGKILIGWHRLNPDGSRDSTFNVDSSSVSGSVYAILRQVTGKAILGGYIWVTSGAPTYYTTALPRIIAGPPDVNMGSMSLLLLND